MNLAASLDVLACPKCKGSVTLEDSEEGLFCKTCHLVYPIRQGIPVMLLEKAHRPGELASVPPSVPPKERPKMKPQPSTAPHATFRIVAGQGKGNALHLTLGTCRAIGRSIDDQEHTQVFSVDANVSLDDFSKKVVMGYIERQFHQKAQESDISGSGMGTFKRDSDLTLQDASISRLHAMFFYDRMGVGVLDLVSKNGTYVNDVEVESQLLKVGDVVSIGGTKLCYES